MEDDDPNWMQAGYDLYWSEIAQNDSEFAEIMKEEDPKQYYSWSWTLDTDCCRSLPVIGQTGTAIIGNTLQRSV